VNEPAARKPKLMVRLRQALRVRHYSYSTEKTYYHWVLLTKLSSLVRSRSAPASSRAMPGTQQNHTYFSIRAALRHALKSRSWSTLAA